MEPAKAKQKRPRPAYKKMWQDVCTELDAVDATMRKALEARDLHERLHQMAEAALKRKNGEYLTLDTTCFRWAIAAVIEGLVLVVAVILLFAR